MPRDAKPPRLEPAGHGPLAGWGIEMPYSVGCRGPDCSDRLGGSQTPSVDIVIAARDQPVGKLLHALLDALPLERIRTPIVWIYHKGRPKPRELAEMSSVIAERAQLRLGLGLPNVGRAEHTCVHHVVQNYASVADLTIFLKDTALAHGHLGVATRLLAFVRRLPAVDAWCARPPVAINLSFALDSYKSETCWRFGRCYTNESWRIASARPFGAWLAHHGIRAIRNMPEQQVQACYGGFFAASRRALTAAPQSTYAAIEAELSQADSLEEGHYMERTWPSLFRLKQPMRSRFVRVGIYTAACGSKGAHNQTALWALPQAASALASSPLLRMPPEYLDDGPSCAGGGCGAADRAWRAGVASTLSFLFFSDQPELLAEAERHGWRGVPLPSATCQVRELKMRPGARSSLRDFDYTAYLTLATETISLGAVLHIVTHHLAVGPAIALVARRRGGLDAARSAERAFLARFGASGAPNRTLMLASAVIRRESASASAFSDRWRELAAANPHVREQFSLDVAVRESSPNAVVVVEPHAAKYLTYPEPP